MKSKILFVLLAIMLAIVPFKEAMASPGKVIELNYASFLPATHVWFYGICKPWAKEIEKRTEGRVKITLYPGGTLVGARETYSSVVEGIADIATGVFDYTPGRFPLMSAFDLPVGFTSSKIGTRVLNEAYKKFKPKELADTKVLYLHVCPPKHVWSTVPIRTLKDLQGLEIRTSVPSIWKALGAVPVAAPQGEVYEMLAKGIVKGNSVSLDCLKGYRQAEVVKYITLNYLYLTNFFVVMNLDKWNALPPDIQKIFEEVSNKWITVAGEAWDGCAYESLGWAVMTHRLEVIHLSPEELSSWHKRVDPLINDWIKDTEAKGLPAREWTDEILRLKAEYSK